MFFIFLFSFEYDTIRYDTIRYDKTTNAHTYTHTPFDLLKREKTLSLLGSSSSSLLLSYEYSRYH